MFRQRLYLNFWLFWLLGAAALAQTPALEARPRDCSLSGRVMLHDQPAANATVKLTARVLKLW